MIFCSRGFFVDIHQHDAKEAPRSFKTYEKKKKDGTQPEKNGNHRQIWICWPPPPHDFGNILDIYLALLPWVGISHKQTKKTNELRNEAERSFKQFDFNHDGTIDGGELMTCF